MGLEERNDAGACHFPATRCLYLPLPSTIRLITRYVLAPLILSRTTFRLYELALKPMIKRSILAVNDLTNLALVITFI